MPPKRRAIGRSTPAAKRKQQQRGALENDENRPMPTGVAAEDNGTYEDQDEEHQTEPVHQKPPAFTYTDTNFDNSCSLGQMTNVCSHCNATKFQGETKSFCCGNGKHKLEALPPLPAEIRDLFTGNAPDSEHFLNNIRKYNCTFQMTSFGCKKVNVQGWNPNFRVQGQICHLVGSLLPAESENAQFLQVYFLDSAAQLETRMSITHDRSLKRNVVNMLQDCLQTHNKYITEIKAAYQYANQNKLKNFNISIHENARPLGEHERRYNAPSCKEVAILMPNEPFGHRDIIICLKNDQLKRICELHPAYDPLQYPLLFPTGNTGWSLAVKINKKVTQLQFYKFYLFTRQGNYLLLARRLLQQFIVDIYAKIECERLQFLRREQGSLRADNYKELRDAIFSADGDSRNVGQKVVLPATFTGGPRYMFERQQDAMAYVRLYGRPDLFITMTTNPKWTEIKEHLHPGQHAHDRPDLTVRVFKLKLQKLMHLLKTGAFGKLQAWLYSIEFQKRGLPHSHILLWLTKESKIRPEAIDNIVCAEIPDKINDPYLHSLVTSNMIHGPCGENYTSSVPVCMKDGLCTKGFPKAFLNETEHGADSYPKYRRRSPDNGGQSVTLISTVNGKQSQKVVDNQWVVPYNPWLLRQLNCHINVEICTSVKSIKYVLKYVHKGSDQATFRINDENKSSEDEIQNFVNARYIGSTEAAWRIFEFPLHERHPSVVQLAVHLENGQRVYFNEQTALQTATNDPPSTTLTAFFKLCREDEFARNLLYSNVPQFYTWDSGQKTWKRRKRGTKIEGQDICEAQTIGRVYTISPRQGECFFLRLLLHNVTGPRSFDELKTVNGLICSTFREACMLLGLLENDHVWHLTLQEAVVSATPQALRSLLAIIITHCNPSDIMTLWLQHKNSLTEDILHLNENMNQQTADNIALVQLEDCVLQMGGQCLHSYGLPAAQRDAAERIGKDYRREVDYDTEQQRERAMRNHTLMTPDQQHVFKTFMKAVEENATGIFFLDAPGGCGKTFLIETILATIRSESKIAIATASSGLAATLITGGRTVHSTFKVPLDLARFDTPMCSVKKGTSLARLIQDCSAIIVDEAPMLNKSVFEALDRTLRDIKSTNETMGGIPFLLCGDFRQILPVVRSGTRADIVNSCIKKSYLWQKVKLLKLTTNMRVHLHDDHDQASFSKLLLEIGNGTKLTVSDPDTVSVLELGNIATSIEDLINKVFPDFTDNVGHAQWLSERAILAPLNETVTKINNKLTACMTSAPKTYVSVNSAVSEDDATHYPVEFLNSIELAGLPPHTLTLKIGMPVMVLRSLNPPKLMNGTRCLVTQTMPNVIEVQICSGPYKNEKHWIPRIILTPSDSGLPFTFQRKQFPVRPCFALTINKAQGQSFRTVGMDLTSPVFSHGMLYVALSRTGDKDAVHILAPSSRTRNVVYPEVLDNIP